MIWGIGPSFLLPDHTVGTLHFCQITFPWAKEAEGAELWWFKYASYSPISDLPTGEKNRSHSFDT